MGLEEGVVDPIVAELEAEGVFDAAGEPAAVLPVAGGEAGDPAAVLLLELVAVEGVGEEVGEVGEEIEVVVEGVGGEAGVELAPWRWASAWRL